MPAAVSLALYHLSADGSRILLLRLAHRLVDMHLCLDMMAAGVHLNVLNLGLIDARALSGEEFLLVMASNDSLLNLVRLRRWALRLGKLLMHTVCFADSMGLLDFDIRVA